jgi:hypothetical protein
MTVQSAAASLAGSSAVSANLSLIVKLPAILSTGGFGGISVDPTSYVYAAAQTIMAAITDASFGGTKARAILVMPRGTYGLPYVNILGVVGSALYTRTGGPNSQLSPQSMIAAIAPSQSGAFVQTLWVAVANFLMQNPALLHADGFQTTRTLTGVGPSILEMYP